MKSNFIYPTMIDEIRTVCSEHVAGSASAEDVQRAVQKGESIIIALEEKDIRNFLTDIEGRLEEVKFAVNDEQRLAETQKIARHVLSWLSERERRGSP